MSNKGFSLTEVMVSILLFALISAGIFAIFLSGERVYNKEAALVDLQQNTRLAMDLMTRELRGGDNVVLDGGDGSITFNVGAETGIKYYYDAGTRQAIREYPTNTLRVLGNDISSLVFEPDGSIVYIHLIASKQMHGVTVSFPEIGNITEEVRLRNE